MKYQLARQAIHSSKVQLREKRLVLSNCVGYGGVLARETDGEREKRFCSVAIITIIFKMFGVCRSACIWVASKDERDRESSLRSARGIDENLLPCCFSDDDVKESMFALT